MLRRRVGEVQRRCRDTTRAPPTPAKIVSASPDTIWFARSVMTRNAWISAIDAPASAATSDRQRERDRT